MKCSVVNDTLSDGGIYMSIVYGCPSIPEPTEWKALSLTSCFKHEWVNWLRQSAECWVAFPNFVRLLLALSEPSKQGFLVWVGEGGWGGSCRGGGFKTQWFLKITNSTDPSVVIVNGVTCKLVEIRWLAGGLTYKTESDWTPRWPAAITGGQYWQVAVQHWPAK